MLEGVILNLCLLRLTEYICFEEARRSADEGVAVGAHFALRQLIAQPVLGCCLILARIDDVTFVIVELRRYPIPYLMELLIDNTFDLGRDAWIEFEQLESKFLPNKGSWYDRRRPAELVKQRPI